MTGQNVDETSHEQHSLPSGKWDGYFMDERMFDGHEAKWPIDVFINFKSDGKSFTGFGLDEIGHFEFKDGNVQGGQIRFVKAYPTHNIYYWGTYTNQHVHGHWGFFQGSPEGEFAMWPLAQSV